MKTVAVDKAQQTAKVQPVESVTIVIDDEIPDFNFLRTQDAYMFEQAARLEKALYYSLPGGTYDRLLGVMLARKSTHFLVAHEEPEKGEGAQ